MELVLTYQQVTVEGDLIEFLFIEETKDKEGECLLKGK
jgi:hypothetical protein